MAKIDLRLVIIMFSPILFFLVAATTAWTQQGDTNKYGYEVYIFSKKVKYCPSN